jgi:hypothetical protein
MGREPSLQGTFAESPFARVLFGLWSGEKTGRLELQAAGGDRSLFLQSGDVIVERAGLSEKDFLAALAKKKVLTIDQARQCGRRAKEAKTSRLRALGELGFLSPLPLWNLMESFFARRLFPLFDLEDGGWTFEPGEGLSVRERLGTLPGQELILHGIRQMQNEAVLDRFLPDAAAPIQVSAPARLHKIAWEPHERYALQVLGSVPHLRAFEDACEIGRKDARKTLFAFVCMGLLAAPPVKARPGAADGPPAGDAGRALEALNEKCAFIYKYVTKEIGPLGRTIIARTLDELKSGLGPQFHKLVLLPDGRLEADPAVSHNAGHLPGELTGALLRGFEEILLAEVLAVKKALGGRHETALVKALEKIGCR